MRVVGLVILLVGLVLVATVTGAVYGAGLLGVGLVVLIVDRLLKRRELTKPGAARFRPVYAPGNRPAPRRRKRAASPAPAKVKAKSKAPAHTRDREPALKASDRFEPIFEGEESSDLFDDLRTEISAGAKQSLEMLRDVGFVIRARSDRVSVSRHNHTDVLRSNFAIVDYVKQLGLSED
jgi:hypothetical protein